MILRRGLRSRFCRLQFLLLLVALGFLVLIATTPDPPAGHLGQRGSVLVGEPIKSGGVGFVETQELLELRDHHQHHFPKDELSPLSSFREDELIAVASPSRKPESQARKGSYKMVKQGRRRDGSSVPKAGDLGEPVLLNLKGAGKQLEESGLQKYGFNEVVSERISLHRRLPEVRHPLCLEKQYIVGRLTATVIISFYNEAWSTLLRTIHSVLDMTPRKLLKEIILVDDLSQQGNLKTALSEYISRLDGVKLIRSNKRLGVIGGRMLGAARATGDVLVFMDSHCECHKGWLEPLLERIAGDRTRVVSPIIDVIDWKTFRYYHSVDPQRGVFDWKLDFHWEALLESDHKGRVTPVSPIRSPTVPGGVLAVDRHYFQKIGAYDPGLSFWGAENLELSIRVWLCGGSVEILPCSRVGHVYRDRMPYLLPDEDAVMRNKIRIAETWLGPFKETFYKHDTAAFLISRVEKPDCIEQLQLQKRLGCRTFQWFLTHIYPELYSPEEKPGYSGELYNIGTGYCADYKAKWGAAGGPVELSPCTGNGNQHFESNSFREIRFGSALQFCLDVRQEQVVLQDCTKEGKTKVEQQWDIQKSGAVVHIHSGKCIEAMENEDIRGLFLYPCNEQTNQMWRFEQMIILNER
ncbi:polypeptide N-acetylgalactosaminyltransferase 15 [Latimeria chalumnae]|uniref:Polypeptide N-acetylgalactosaminyltransferase n=1 Tax=Latimeria chalumnae TaxID=7897 RepID=H3AMH1_LATCH|nr:PREDICTED: polypeptide N-acetylgalactosaminyltransferase 15 [Latimeria chalumnae]|eukprot:XP_014347978.1 PREDICTED: polypeptide N-acetylgalactosaminyltransferase 15 [Latimeria chalumnae]